jgi:homoserine dehydrogenase
VEKLKNASWFNDRSVSIILLPDSITEKEAIISSSLKKVSLQLAGVN